MLEDLTTICLDTMNCGKGVEMTFDDLKDYFKSRVKEELEFDDEQAETSGEIWLGFWQSPPPRVSHAQLAGIMAAEIINQLEL